MNRLLTAILGPNANSFINTKTLGGLEMYEKVLNVFQGDAHEDRHGNTTRLVSNVLIPSIFRAKVDNPTYNNWKDLSETNKEDW